MSLAEQMCNRKRSGLAGFHLDLQRITEPISQSTDCRSFDSPLRAEDLLWRIAEYGSEKVASIGLIVMKRKKGYRVKENPLLEEVYFS